MFGGWQGAIEAWEKVSKEESRGRSHAHFAGLERKRKSSVELMERARVPSGILSRTLKAHDALGISRSKLEKGWIGSW